MCEYDRHKSIMYEKIVKPLLEDAKNQKLIQEDVNIELFHYINFDDIDEKLWKYKIFDKYSVEVALNYFIILKLKGIVTEKNFNLL